MKKIAVILSGCGFKDGAEITESVSSLIALGEFGADYECFAPDESFTATNHRTDDTSGERNIMDEASRISRGKIRPITELKESDFDGILFPGGYGAALHLSTWAKEGSSAKLLLSVEKAIKDFHEASKPIGAICISPTLVAKVLGDFNVTVTIGNDTETAQEIEKTGANHEDCPVTDYITDRENKVITTPAYMYDEAKPVEVYTGIKALVKELVEMA